MRKILISIDDSEQCEEAVKWAIEHIYHQGDEVHLIHVIPRLQIMTSYAPPVDFLPYHDPAQYEGLIKDAEKFIAKRALAHMPNTMNPTPIIHLVKYDIDSDSIGNAICRKAEELDAVVTIMARHNKTKLQEFFLGSVTSFCLHHSKKPVLVFP